ncbi:MAG: putative oxidoreductase [Chloroflexi bacterium]|nr:MAG: putative oxidoreductase [Chloroflexota bacterium]
MKDYKRIVLITGSAGGIGRATVNLFAAQGWSIIGVDCNEFGEGFPVDGLFIKADISKSNQFAFVYDKLKQFTASLNAVVNNAAVQISKPLVETTVEEWDHVIATNLRPVFIGARYAHPLLCTAGGGAIVNVSSVHAIQTSANIAAYAASKGGLLALTRAMAIEFAPNNIRVNAVLPGAVDTPMLRSGLERGHLSGPSVSERLDNLAAKTVNGRIGTPDEIAHAIYFLADGVQSSFMTGQALVVDGGATARLSTE